MVQAGWKTQNPGGDNKHLKQSVGLKTLFGRKEWVILIHFIGKQQTNNIEQKVIIRAINLGMYYKTFYGRANVKKITVELYSCS